MWEWGHANPVSDGVRRKTTLLGMQLTCGVHLSPWREGREGDELGWASMEKREEAAQHGEKKREGRE